jgi:hypothetical protein
MYGQIKQRITANDYRNPCRVNRKFGFGEYKQQTGGDKPSA